MQLPWTLKICGYLLQLLNVLVSCVPQVFLKRGSQVVLHSGREMTKTERVEK